MRVRGHSHPRAGARRSGAIAAALVAAVAGAALGPGCSAGFENPAIVLDLRVLGAVAEPAELVLDVDPMDPIAIATALEQNPVMVSALVADPDDDRRLAWDMALCAPTRSLRCDDPEATVATVGSGTVDDPETAGAIAPAAAFVINPLVLEESISADSLAGFGGIAVQLQIRVWPDGGDPATAVYASKRLVVAPRVPAERLANQNPWILEVRHGAGPDAQPESLLAEGTCEAPGLTPLVLARGQKLRLLPVEPAEVRENYVLPTFDGEVQRVTEYMRYAWFATGGDFDRGQSGGATDAFGNIPTLDVVFSAPGAPGDVRLWLVQRDERGGTAWKAYCLRVE
jgi:hypothetical protein